jgi:integrase
MAGRTVKKDGKSWYFVLTYGKKENGKPRQIKRRGFKTKQEALKSLHEHEHSLMIRTYTHPTKMLYREYLLDQWLEDK